MTKQANIVRQPRLELGGIHDGSRTDLRRHARLYCENMSCARAVAAFAPNCQLLKWRLVETTVSIRDNLRTTAVAGNASRKNGAGESIVRELIARRQSPCPHRRIERQWRLKKVVSAPHNSAEAVRASAQNPFHSMRVAKDLFTFCREFKFALVQISIALVYFKVPVQSLAKQRRRSRNL